MESKVAKAILQDELEVRVGTEVYRVAPPTLSTLIRISELGSKLPKPTDDVLGFAIDSAKDAKIIGDMVATLILGERKLKTTQYIDTFKKISRDSLYMSEIELGSLIVGILNRDHAEGFYLLITSLRGGNLLAPTTIQSGQ